MLPAIAQYAPEVQRRAADELAALPPPCPGDAVTDGCSALHRLVIDYDTLRCRIRAADPTLPDCAAAK